MSPRERNIVLTLTVVVFLVVVVAALTLLQPASGPVPTPGPNLVVTAGDVAAMPTYAPDATLAPELRPNDPYFDRQWYLPAIGAPQAWPNLPADQPQVVVAVIDTGICLNHPDLEGRITGGIDMVNEQSPREIAGNDFPIDRPLLSVVAPMQDAANHGCAMASIIAANTNNAIGIAGIAPNALIMPIKVLDATGNGTVETVASAIHYAVDNGANIISLSIIMNPGSTDDEVSAITEAVNYAAEHGIPIVASAGNTYGGSARMPSSFDSVIAVGALTEAMEPSEISAAIGINVWAPGVGILSASIFPQNGQLAYETFEGASIAAAIVSGVLAARGSVPIRMINGLPVVDMGG